MTMNEQLRGFAFPFRIDPKSGGVAQTSGRDKIRQNVRVVLGTRLGERPMVRDYGSQLHALVHDPNDDIIGEIARNQIQQALMRWEPRIVVTSARVEQEGGELRLHLDYVHSDAPVGERMLVPLK